MEEMPKTYDPSENEPKILQKWLDGGYYQRRAGKGDCTVVIPPPRSTSPATTRTCGSSLRAPSSPIS